MIKLNQREMERLVEIGQKRFTNFGVCKKTNTRLVEKGLIEEIGGKIAKTGRVVWHGNARLTDAGRDVLKGLPS